MTTTNIIDPYQIDSAAPLQITIGENAVHCMLFTYDDNQHKWTDSQQMRKLIATSNPLIIESDVLVEDDEDLNGNPVEMIHVNLICLVRDLPAVLRALSIIPRDA